MRWLLYKFEELGRYISVCSCVKHTKVNQETINIYLEVIVVSVFLWIFYKFFCGLNSILEENSCKIVMSFFKVVYLLIAFRELELGLTVWILLHKDAGQKIVLCFLVANSYLQFLQKLGLVLRRLF